MANKRINDLTGSASVLNSYVMEVDDGTFVESKKATVEVVTQIERDARIAQDNVIEAGAGLNADGTYTPPAGSGYMTAAAFAAAGYTENMFNGMRLLDEQIQTNAADIANILLTTTRVLTVAEINTLFTAPVVLVDTSAFAVNVIVDVIDCVAWINYTAPAWDVGAQTLDVGYDSAADILTFTEAFVESAADAFQKATPIDNAVMSVATDIVARLNSANPTAPPGGSEITIYLSYRLITTS